MGNAVPFARTLGISECGFDEFWLQERIAADPSCLGLGDLELVSKEHRQKAGGRLDLLLKNPDDNAMYEVEIMLGSTDESHIVRTIEYWDNERRRWPQREHFAVLVAELVTRRFFNVIQLLSHSIPIIAIQANIVESEGHKSLHFTKVLDSYEEPEELGADEIVGEDVWRRDYPGVFLVANALAGAIKPVNSQISLKYYKTIILLRSGGNTYFWLKRRKGNRARVGIWLTEGLLDKGTVLLEDAGFECVRRPGNTVYLSIEKTAVESKPEVFRQITKLIQESLREK